MKNEVALSLDDDPSDPGIDVENDSLGNDGDIISPGNFASPGFGVAPIRCVSPAGR
jgi:hypothetical protein